MFLYAATIILSSFLLFLIQPVLAKQISPWFGGAAAVWTTCLVFFQVVLLLGYAYADWTTRHLRPKVQAWVHGTLLAASLGLLPVVASARWRPLGDEDPASRILGLLAATVGLPYFLLCATGPLIQTWFSRRFPGRTPYRLFALSNLSSVAGLLAFPFVVEPRSSALQQSHGWSIAYALFALSCAGCALRSLRSTATGIGSIGAVPGPERDDGRRPRGRERAAWLGFATLGSFLLLAISDHLCLQVASIPFLWVAPLSLYLLSFVLCFDGRGWYRRSASLPLTAVLLVVMAAMLTPSRWSLDVRLAIPVWLAGLLACCMFCHGELAARKPAAAHLTEFYLVLALGGAVGALLVGAVAPHVLSGCFELGLGLLAAASLLALGPPRGGRLGRAAGWTVCALVAVGWLVQVDRFAASTRVMKRSFYGTLRTWDTLTRGRVPIRQLIHGAIRHGEQFLEPARRREPTSYFSPRSGIGLALRAFDRPIRVGVVGLGVGALAAYGRPGDYYRFYELDPQVVEIARTEFTFLADLEARYDVVVGDGRLSLEREPPQELDVLVLDAFAGHAVPTHLLTREAMAIYLRHLRPGGVLAFDATNRHLDIVPVVDGLARASGLEAIHVPDLEVADDPDGFASTDWVLVAPPGRWRDHPPIVAAAQPIPIRPGLRPWTDDYNDLFQILK